MTRPPTLNADFGRLIIHRYRYSYLHVEALSSFSGKDENTSNLKKMPAPDELEHADDDGPHPPGMRIFELGETTYSRKTSM